MTTLRLTLLAVGLLLCQCLSLSPFLSVDAAQGVSLSVTNAPSYLYENQVWPGVTIQAIGKLHPNLTLTAAITPTGLGSARLSSASFDLSSGSVTFTVTAPVSALDSSLNPVVVSVSFTASGPDASVTTPATFNFNINILQQGQLKVVGNPANLIVLRSAQSQMKVVSDTTFPVLDPASAVAKAMGITSGITVIPFISSTTCSTCETDGSLPGPPLIWQPTLTGQFPVSPKDTDQALLFTAPQQAMIVTIGFKFDAQPGSNIYQYKLPPMISIVINPLYSWQVLAPPFVYAGSKSPVSFSPSNEPPHAASFLQISTCSNVGTCGTVKDPYGVVSPIYQVTNNLVAKVTFEAPSVVTSTTVLLSFSTSGSEDVAVMQLPAPLPVSIIVSPLNKWQVSNLPISVNPGSNLIITVTPSEIPTATVVLTIYAPNDMGNVQPVALTFPAGSNAPQSAVVIASSGPGLLTLAFNSSNPLYLPPGNTGTYVLATVTVENIPATMYANQTTIDNLRVTPSTDLSLTNGLQVTARLTAGSMQPESLSFSSMNSQNFIMSSPVLARTPLNATLSFFLSDVAAVRFAPVPSSNILILPQESFIITNLSSTELYYNETVTFTVSLTAPPNQGVNYAGLSALVLCMGIWVPTNRPKSSQGDLTSNDFDAKLDQTGATRYCIGDRTSSLITIDQVIPALSWPYQAAGTGSSPSVFRFTYRAPIDAFSLQIRFESQGPDMRHFMNPAPINITSLGLKPSASTSSGGAAGSSSASANHGDSTGTSGDAGLNEGGSTGSPNVLSNAATAAQPTTCTLGLLAMMIAAALSRFF